MIHPHRVLFLAFNQISYISKYILVLGFYVNVENWVSRVDDTEKGWNWAAECNNIGERYTRKNVLFLRWRGERYVDITPRLL